MGEGLGLQKIIKPTPSNALDIRINLVFLALFLVAYASLLLQTFSSVYFGNATSLVRCSLHGCHHKVEKWVNMEAVLKISDGVIKPTSMVTLTLLGVSSFVDDFGKGLSNGTVNFEDVDYSEWCKHGQIIPVTFDRDSTHLEGQHLFPEWIDEEEDTVRKRFPKIPKLDFSKYDNMDLIVAKLQCKYPVNGWARDVFMLQLHLIAANLAVKNGKNDWN